MNHSASVLGFLASLVLLEIPPLGSGLIVFGDDLMSRKITDIPQEDLERIRRAGREYNARVDPDKRERKRRKERERYTNSSRQEKDERNRKARLRHANRSPEQIRKKQIACEKWEANQTAEWRKKKSQKQTEARRAYYLWRKYRITIEEYRQLMIAQRGRCALCGKKLSQGIDHPIDHDHTKRGRESIRGILHARCNTFLGYFERDMKLIQKAESYLRKHGQRIITEIPDPNER